MAHLDEVRLLESLFGRVFVPPSVAEELLRPPRRFASVDVRRFAFLEIRRPVSPDSVADQAGVLHAGEREALALAVELAAGTVLIDERAGRRVALSLGLHAIGTLGVLLAAKHQGHLGAIAPLVSRLEQELGFFIGDNLRREFLTNAGELAEDQVD